MHNYCQWVSLTFYGLEKCSPCNAGVLTSLCELTVVFFKLQAFWPVLRVPHIAHGKEVLPSSHRDGSPVSRESN